MESGKVQDLTSYFEEDPEWKAQFDESSLEFNSVDGKIYGVPVSKEISYIYYNKDLFEQAGLEATKQDITSNPKNVEIVEMEAAQLPRALADVDFAVINGNYAVAAEIADQVLVTEDKDSEAAKQYANIVAVREGDENREDIKALVEALQSDEVKAYIEETFGSTVIPVF